MSIIAAALRGNMMFFQPRHFARWRSERVSSTDDAVAAAEASAARDDDEEGAFVNRSNNANNATAPNRATEQASSDVDIEAAPIVTQGSASAAPSSLAVADDSVDSDDEDDDTDGVARHTIRHNISLAELEEARELARRRSSVCVILALFVLFRLWILALEEGDFGLLLLCLIGSSWTARWIRYNRDQEEELDRRIANYLSNPEGGNDAQVPRDDLRMLSFQAQLALAIMESQRQMMQGGHGHPDGNGNQTPGVSETARSQWKQFTYQAAVHDTKDSRRGTYGAVTQQDVVTKPGIDIEQPHCSICLGEYEEGEKLTTLPCSHTYHDECIASWCSNHIRCPLCNYNLESEPVNEAV